MLEDRVKELESKISEADEHYRAGNPIISDSEYDRLVGELRSINPDSYVLQILGGEDSGGGTPFTEAELKYIRSTFPPMRSIRPVFTLDNAREYGIHMYDTVSMAKADGAAVDMYYRHGELVFASTRGRDGRQGKNVTAQLSMVVPTYVEMWSEIEWVSVRGEAVITYEHFDQMCEKYSDDPPSNPRNSVQMILKESFDNDDVSFLTFLAYKVYYEDAPNTLSEKLAELMEIGFTVIDAWNDSADPLFEPYNVTQNDFPYPTDGLVVCVDDETVFDELGDDGKYDAGQLALKYGDWENAVYSSKIVSIEFGHAKRYITPVAIIEPVYTPSGKEVKRVSLFNVANIVNHNIQIGTTVYFTYVSEINPKFLASEFTFTGNIEDYKDGAPSELGQDMDFDSYMEMNS